MNKKTIALHTLGCRLNQAETESIASELQNRKYSIVPFEDNADVYILNTCTVTAQADRKSRNLINRAQRQGPSPIVIVTGCFVDHHKEKLHSEAQTYYVTNNRKAAIPDLVDAHFQGEVVHPDALDQSAFSFIPAERIFRTRSLVKIQEGCDNFCTFCIIPFVRGKAQSRPLADIVENIKIAADNDSREIVITGVNMSRYNDDGKNFTTMLETILDIDGNFRIRISSLEPEGLGEHFVELMEHPKLCPHLHLCLQSGSEKILLRMRRCYTAQQFTEMVHAIRKQNPRFNISTDIIVGFPGEGEVEFADSAAIAKDLAFTHIHIFPYSVRAHTRAARMEGKVDMHTIKERAEILKGISDANKYSYRKSFLGLYEELLIEKNSKKTSEKNDKRTSSGLGRYYVPIELDRHMQINSLLRVKITELTDDTEQILRATPA